MAHPLLARLEENERMRVLQLTKHLTLSLSTYFETYPAFNPVRFPATALTSAVENPSLPISILEQIVRVPAWIFTIDAVIDEQLMDEVTLRRNLRIYEEIVRGQCDKVDSTDPYGCVLLALRQDLAKRKNFKALEAHWVDAYVRMIAGMLFETYDRVANPTWEEYISHGTYSIGLPMYLVSTWIFQTDEDLTADLPELLKMMELSGAAIRLANDLRTFEKEEQENNLNAIFVQEMLLCNHDNHRDALILRQVAFEKVRSALRDVYQRFLGMVDEMHPLKRALGRLTEFSVGFYHEQDFHTVNESDVLNLIQCPLTESREA